jgi:hypothetical protein
MGKLLVLLFLLSGCATAPPPRARRIQNNYNQSGGVVINGDSIELPDDGEI